MKIKLLSFLFCCVSFFYSCQEDEDNLKAGKIEFSFTEQSHENQRLKSEASPAFILVSVEDAAGNSLLDKKKLEVYNFNGSYLSEPVELDPGNYQLTNYMVLDQDGNVLLASPKEGSKLAYLVEDPLPLSFSSQSNETTKVNPEVVSVSSFNPKDFGYSTFSFNVVSTIDFLMAIFIYDPLSDNFELTPANVTIFDSDNTELFNQQVIDSTTFIRIVDRSEKIKIVVEKDGFNPYVLQTTVTELQSYSSSPLIISLSTDTDLSEGLVAHYPLNGNLEDVSGNQLHGSAFGGSFTTDQNNIANQAYYFNGINDHIKINNSSILETQQFTFSCWISAESDTGAIVSLSEVPSSYNNCGYYLKHLNSQPAGQIMVDSYNFVWSKVETDKLIQQNEWQHLVFTYDQVEMKIYLNGQLIGSTPEERAVDYREQNPMILGGYSTRTTGGTWFKGKMDEVKIYNRSLSSTEVNALFNN